MINITPQMLGLFAANSADHDDLLVYADDERKTPLERLCHLRQQRAKPEGQAQNCLADFVAPGASGLDDYIGAFAVTAGIGIDERVAQFEKASIVAKLRVARERKREETGRCEGRKPVPEIVKKEAKRLARII